ncbi:MAG: subtype I-C CRISPR-associated endonuclease Cas1 [Acidobacteria bacterium]|nr:MAG: subtype I-C CRISPR-associated endonuclease Cas1 [Acidobacteriota bacterium]
MRKLLNTLHVMTQGAYVHRDGETVAVKIDSETRLRVPVHTLEGLVCWGHVSCSPPVLALCCEKGVGISFLAESGHFLARVQGPVSGNVLLRRQQYRSADDAEHSLGIVRMIVAAKVANSRIVILRAAREVSDPTAAAQLREAAGKLAEIGRQALQAATAEEARGHEGIAGRIYFSAFDAMVVGNRETFVFRGRSRRPPLDPINALLSFAYALLRHDVESALESVGLDPAVGFLHTDRPGRPSLALDLMEELRSAIADRLVLTLINRRQLGESDFSTQDNGSVVLSELARKTLVSAWQQRKQEEIMHPFLEERIAVGLIPYAQALLMARFLRGGLDAYPAFLWR